MILERPSFATRQEYSRCFRNPSYWHAYVAAMCARHELGDPTTVRAGFPGTNPVFIVDEKYAVKLYTDLFDDERSYLVEREVYRLIATSPDIPAPSLIATGNLFDAHDGWPWPSIVTRALPGLSMSESVLSDTDRLVLAAWLGPVVRRIHSLPLAQAGPLPPRPAQHDKEASRGAEATPTQALVGVNAHVVALWLGGQTDTQRWGRSHLPPDSRE